VLLGESYLLMTEGVMQACMLCLRFSFPIGAFLLAGRGLGLSDFDLASRGLLCPFS